MVVVQLTGGLGNQLFQYATAKALSSCNQQTVFLDIQSYQWDKLRVYELEKFNIKAQIADQEISNKIKNSNVSFIDKFKHFLTNTDIKYYRLPYIKEQNFSFDQNFNKFRNKHVYLEGYWQSELYFYNVRNEIITEIRDFNLLKYNSIKLYQKITSKKCPISLHVRRGDYVDNKNTNEYHGTCSNEYYKNAIQLIEKEIDDVHFFVFSDDKEYVNEFYKDSSKFTIINDIHYDYEELLLMSACKHHIIANSSFSWWGAWLNPNSEKRVIAPINWFKNKDMQKQISNLLPSNWVKI